MGSTGGRRAVAFAPGHVTGLFVPDLRSPDPRGRGSRGAGLVLELGATAVAEHFPAGRSALHVSDVEGSSLPITEEAARHLRPPGSGTVRVRVRHDLPVGQGFGMSAAGTLAASIALSRIFDLPRHRAVEVAHLADLFGGGGLGGVPAILGGGLEVRTVAGVPPWGRVTHRPVDRRILVGVVGRSIPSPTLLHRARFLHRVSDAAARELDRLGSRPSLETLLDASEGFTDRLALAPPRLRKVLRGLRARGARAAQAMFGESFFALASSAAVRRRVVEYLASTGVRALEVGTAGRGAHPLPLPAHRGAGPRVATQAF
jgi:pantoate kinase